MHLVVSRLWKASVLVAAVGLLPGCIVRGYVPSHAYLYYGSPDVVAVEPGVWIAEGGDVPVYYGDGSYWRYEDGLWYRSDLPTGGWVSVDFGLVPTAIVRIDQRTYRHHHYRGGHVMAHRSDWRRRPRAGAHGHARAVTPRTPGHSRHHG